MKATSSYFSLSFRGSNSLTTKKASVLFGTSLLELSFYTVFGLFSQLIKVLQARKNGFGLGFQSFVCKLVGHGEHCYIMSELNNSKPQK